MAMYNKKSYIMQEFLKDFSERQMSQFRNAFLILDKDGGGTITTTELYFVMSNLLGHQSDTEHLKEFVDQYDTNVWCFVFLSVLLADLIS